MKIHENIYTFENIKGANSYLYTSENGEISIIDTGLPGNCKAIINQITELGIEPRSIHNIILTHADKDHNGSSFELKIATGAHLAIHAKELPFLSGMKEINAHNVLSFLVRFFLRFIRITRPDADIILNDGDMVGGLRVIH